MLSTREIAWEFVRSVPEFGKARAKKLCEAYPDKTFFVACLKEKPSKLMLSVVGMDTPHFDFSFEVLKERAKAFVFFREKGFIESEVRSMAYWKADVISEFEKNPIC